MKRFLINDNQTYSEEILNLFIDVIYSLGTESWFSDKINSTFINYSRVEYIVKSKFGGKMPKQMIDRIFESIDDKSSVFLSQKKIFISNIKLEYFKVIKNIYSAIISKRNSSVSKIFIAAFNLNEKGKDAPIMEDEIKDFIVNDLKISISNIEQSPR